MKDWLLAMAVVAGVVLLAWLAQSSQRRTARGGTSGQDGWVGADAAGDNHGFDGHGHSGDHGSAGDTAGSGGGDGGGGDGGSGGGGD